jgi:hypothetical protein
MDRFDRKEEQLEKRKVIIWKRRIIKGILSLLLMYNVYIYVL